MARKNRVQMPQSTAGLVRYYDQETKSALKIKPEQMVAVIVVIIAIELALRFMF
jgi:preprotein translocase subunit Sec61beta